MRIRVAIFETLLCLLGVLGLGATLVPDYRHVRDVDYVATDFKTLYASAAVLARHGDPYSLTALAEVFRRDGVVEPGTWFGRSPVYPPVTLMMVAPLTMFDMAAAAWVWFGLSLLVFGAALAAVLAVARARGLAWPWRLGLIAFGLANPYLGYALNVGNASVLVAGLYVAAWMLLSVNADGWVLPAVMLAGGLVLKPHVAIWVVVGLVVFPTARSRVAALGAVVLGVGLTLASVLQLAAGGILQGTFSSYAALLAGERGSGSMSAASRVGLPLEAQITAMRTLPGFSAPGAGRAISVGILVAITAVLGIAAVRFRRQAGEDSSLLGVSAVACFGLVATYHRAHDSLILLPLMLWVARTISAPGQPRGRWVGFLVLGVYGTTWIPIDGGALPLRQGALLFFVLTVILAVLALRGTKKGGMNGDLSMPGGQ